MLGYAKDMAVCRIRPLWLQHGGTFPNFAYIPNRFLLSGEFLIRLDLSVVQTSAH